MEELSDDTYITLMENAIKDRSKKDYDPLEWARLVWKIKKNKNYSLKSFSKLFNVSKSTVEFWLLPLTRNSEYKRLIRIDKMSPTKAHTYLQNNREPMTRLSCVPSDIGLEKILNMIKSIEREAVRTAKTDDLLKDIRNELNKFEMYADQNNGVR